MMKRFCSLHAVIGALLLCGNIPAAIAEQYFKLVLDNCSIEYNKLVPGTWNGSFDIIITPAGTTDGATTGALWVEFGVPQLASDGRAKGLRYLFSPFPSQIVSFQFPAALGLLNKRSPNNDRVYIGNSNKTATMDLPFYNKTITHTVKFTIKTTGADGFYPAAYIGPYSSAIGTIFESQGTYWAIPGKSGSCTSTQDPGGETPAITELIPVDPEFTMKAAEWVLQTADVGDLPNVTAAGTGYPATINNVSNNNLCVNYVTAGVKKNQYALAVTNSSSSQGGRNLFTLPGTNGSKLYYNLQLASNDGNAANNFNFPATGTPNYITLGQANNYSSDHSEMCWTPKVNLFKDASTTDGSHADSLSFIIMPKA